MVLGQLAEDCLITDSIRVGIHDWRIRSSHVNDHGPLGKFRNRGLTAICFHDGAQ